MDTGKLIKVIDDIRADEQASSFQAILESIYTYYQQNDPDSVNEAKDDVIDGISTSRIFLYGAPEYKVLEKLEAVTFFGPGLLEELNNILDMQAHEVVAALQAFTSKRATKLTSLNQLRASLVEVGFESRQLTDGDYEIAFSLPNEYLEVSKTREALDDLYDFLNALSHAIDKQQPLKIKYVSSGSIEFYIQAGVDLAQNFDIVLDYALKIYAAIEATIHIKKAIKKRMSKKHAVVAEKSATASLKEETEEFTNQMIESLQLKSEDDKNRVKMLFKRFLNHIEKGVSAEVLTPKLQAPAEPPEDASTEDEKKYKSSKKAYKRNLAIEQRNREMFELQQGGFDEATIKLLEDPEISNDELQE